MIHIRKHHDPRPDIAGERHPMAKLSHEDVLEILRLHPRFSMREIAKLKGISYSAVWRIVNRRSWRHLSRE